MLEVWICDDNVPFAENLGKMIRLCLNGRDENHEIRVFSSAGKIREALAAQSPDLIFLDLLLPDGDGYALAEEIRRRHLSAEIVFVTGYPEKMPDAFDYRPIGFLPKPVTEKSVRELLDRYFSFYLRTQNTYLVETRAQNLRIPLEKILYFESSGHKVLIYCSNETEPLVQVEKLDVIAEALKSSSFVRCHKSFLCNIAAIRQIDRTRMRIVLHNGVDLPISRSYHAAVMEQFIQTKLR